MSGYIGTQPVPQATQTRDSFTATSGQTSFATGGYTPNFLDVYLNGVKLASADYTATNGSDVVLASGASTGDILEVVAFTTFTPANIPSGTPSIDDNGNATAITIDSSENVLIGKASADGTGSTGHDIRATGLAYHTVDGGDVKVLNRLNSNGSILSIRKDGTTVGSIAVDPSNIAIGSGDTGIYFNSGDDALIPVGTGGNLLTSRDNAIDLGRTNARFKDAYIGGGVYLGGTGSANKLDDYEEGTFTATLAGSISSPTTAVTITGYYTKVGNTVGIYVNFETVNTSGANGNMSITGLPFANSGAFPILSCQMNLAGTFPSSSPFGLINGSICYFYKHASNDNVTAVAHNAGTNRSIRVSGNYRVA